MLDFIATHHAKTRFKQRGLREVDIDLVMANATRVAPDAYLLTNRDVELAIMRRKQEIQRLERLRGLKVVVEGDVIITGYHSRVLDQKKTLRRGRQNK